jgi:hypothetical protein
LCGIINARENHHLLKKKTVTFGDASITFAELNRFQAKELLKWSSEVREAPKTEEEMESRFWHTIAISVNNAVAPPTEASPLGSDAGVPHLQATIGFASSKELHSMILDLSGLTSTSSGETPAPS